MIQHSLEEASDRVTSINFRSRTYQAAKCYWHGTHRSASPEETLERIRPYFKSVGLTRLGNITHLDCIGIPVTISIRPNSYSIVTSSGKGTTLEAALVSAAMESIELYCAENISIHEIHLPYAKLGGDYDVIKLGNMPLRPNSLFNVNWTEQWYLGWDVVNQIEVACPVQAVSMDYRILSKNFKNIASFDVCSNGLASGNHFLEALSSALFEVIERDAVTCHIEAALRVGYQKPRVLSETIPYPAVQKMLAQLEAVNIVPVLYDCTIDTEVPVYLGHCYDKNECYVPSGYGYGAHLDPEVAMLRALTEAVQSRAILISGARDDLFRQYYTAIKVNNKTQNQGCESDKSTTIDARLRKSEATSTFEEDINLVLQKLKRVGLDRVIVFDLSPPEWDIAVVRVVVPGLEGYYHKNYLPKHRALAFAKSKKYTQINSPSAVVYKEIEAHLPAGGIS